MKTVTEFARAGTGAIDELIATLPDDVQARLADAVAGGARLAIGMSMDGRVGSFVYLDLVDVEGTAHRTLTVTADGKVKH